MPRLVLVLILASACGSENGQPVIDGPPGGTIDGPQGVDAAPGAPDARPADGPPSLLMYNVMLTTAMETPPCGAAGAGATGSATVIIDENDTITVTDLTFANLSGPATLAHIHYGDTGVGGPGVLTFGALASPINQTFTAADYPSPAPVGAPLTYAAFAAELRLGNSYINIHTTACSNGEIRGQIE